MDVEDLRELKSLLAQASRPRVQQFLRNRVAQIESRLVADRDGSVPVVSASATPASVSAVAPAPRRRAPTSRPIDSYYWLETRTTMKVFIDLDPPVDPSVVTHTLTWPNLRSFIFRMTNGTVVSELSIGNLKEEINADASSVRVKSARVILFLRKSSPGMWNELQKKTDDMAERLKKTPGPSADSDDPSSGLMDLMRNMYDTGDDDMKRMLKKTWYESMQKKNQGGADADQPPGMGGMGGLGGMGGM